MNNPNLPEQEQAPTTVGSGAWLGDISEELNAALNLAAAPWPLKRKEWMEAAMQMAKYCTVSENCDQAAMRVLAAEVLRLRQQNHIGDVNKMVMSPNEKS